jgi:very-short-patch-repair endonuclease
LPDRWQVPHTVRERSTAAARALRKDATPTEAILWHAIRGKQLGAKFRRQQPIGHFIADFYCSEARLVLEIDGSVHDAQPEYDRERQELLESLGLGFLRITATDVERDLGNVLERIRLALTPHP